VAQLWRAAGGSAVPCSSRGRVSASVRGKSRGIVRVRARVRARAMARKSAIARRGWWRWSPKWVML
jgi:hypothetical protein